MNKMNKLAVTVAACGLIFTSTAKALDLINVPVKKAVEVTTTGNNTDNTSEGKETKSVSELLADPNVTLTRDQFIEYLKEVQKLNPNATWQQIITRMHYERYFKDHKLTVATIPLFHNGDENKGWETIKLPNGYKPPKFITDNKGNKVDIAHAYAGIRGGLNRSGVTKWAMKNVNTGWGDSLQVVNGYILGARSYLKGAVTLDGSKFSEGNKHFSSAPNYKPEDQIRGNNLGIQVENYLREHPQATMSQAFDACLARSTKGTDYHDDIFYGAAVSPLGVLIKRNNVGGSIVKRASGNKKGMDQILRQIGSSAITGGTYSSPLIQRHLFNRGR